MPALLCSEGHENPTSNSFCSVCGEQLDLGPFDPALAAPDEAQRCRGCGRVYATASDLVRHLDAVNYHEEPVDQPDTAEARKRRGFRWQHGLAIVIGILAAIQLITVTYTSTDFGLRGFTTLDCGNAGQVLISPEGSCSEHRGEIVAGLAVVGGIIVGLLMWGDDAAKSEDRKRASGSPAEDTP